MKKCLHERENAPFMAHNALCDALCVKLLYAYLLEIKSHLELVELTSNPYL